MSNGDGPIFSGGHQFMRAGRGHATLRREKPLARRGPKIGPYAASIELVPLTGGQEHYYDVCARWAHPLHGSVGTSRLVRGENEAWRYFHELVDVLSDPGPGDERLRPAIGDA